MSSPKQLDGAEPWKFSWEPVPPPPTPPSPPPPPPPPRMFSHNSRLSGDVTLLRPQNREGHVQQINIVGLTATGYTIWREKSLTLFSGEVRTFAPWLRSCFWRDSRRFFIMFAVITLQAGKQRNRGSFLGWGNRLFSHNAHLGSGEHSAFLIFVWPCIIN